MGTKRVGLARTQKLLENLKREIDLSTSTILKNAQLTVAEESATYGAGAISTEVAPSTFIQNVGGDIITTIQVDLTGLKKASDVGDVIGLDGVNGAYLLQFLSAKHGILYKVEVSCIELPTGTNVLKDFDLIVNSSATLAFDGDASGGDSIFAAGGNFALGTTIQNLAVTQPTNAEYLYLCEGATSSDAQVFTAGKLVIKLFGRASF
jgi:hypothetical protein